MRNKATMALSFDNSDSNIYAKARSGKLKQEKLGNSETTSKKQLSHDLIADLVQSESHMAIQTTT